MFVLALIGEYIGRLYNEVKHRPLYIVQELVGSAAEHARLGYIAEDPPSRAPHQPRRRRVHSS